MPIRKCTFLRLSGADHRLEYTWGVAQCNNALQSGRVAPTRKVTIHPEKAALPFMVGSCSHYDKLEAHLFEPLYTTRCVWDWRGIVNSVSLIVLLHFALEGRPNQRRIDEASGEAVQMSP